MHQLVENQTALFLCFQDFNRSLEWQTVAKDIFLFAKFPIEFLRHLVQDPSKSSGSVRDRSL